MRAACLRYPAFSLLMVVALISATAQPYTSVKGTFKVDEIKGCQDFTTNITVAPTAANGNCAVFNIIPGDGGLERQNTVPCSYTYTYTRTGQFWLKVRIQGGANNTDSIRITVEPNLEPSFELSSCNGSSVQVRITDKNYDQYFIDFDYLSPAFTTDTAMASAPNLQGKRKYPDNVIRQIAVQGKDIQSARNCKVASKSFTPLTVLPLANPEQLRIADANTLELDFSPKGDVEYKLDIAVNSGDAFQAWKNIRSNTTGSRTEVLGDLRNNDNYYCLRLRTYDPCTTNAQNGGSICSIRLGLSISDDVNQLNWQTSSSGISRFEVKRNDNPAYKSLAGTSLSDTEIICATDYCYSVTGFYSNGATTISTTLCGRSKTARIPDAIRDVAAETSVSGAKVNLTWVQPGGFQPKAYVVYRALPGGPQNPAGIVEDPVFEDALETERSYPAYRIDYQDVCDKTSKPGSTFLPLRLSAELLPDNRITLRWNKYRGYRNGILRDTIVQVDQNGEVIRKFATNDSTITDSFADTVNQIVTYRLITTATDPGLPKSFSNEVTVERDARLFFPTAFTPDGNNLNERFRLYGQFARRIRIQIFDRWGTLLFQADSQSPDGRRDWDGTGPGGIPVPQSVYVWKALVTDFSGKEFLRTGSVALIRK